MLITIAEYIQYIEIAAYYVYLHRMASPASYAPTWGAIDDWNEGVIQINIMLEQIGSRVESLEHPEQFIKGNAADDQNQ